MSRNLPNISSSLKNIQKEYTRLESLIEKSNDFTAKSNAYQYILKKRGKNKKKKRFQN